MKRPGVAAAALIVAGSVLVGAVLAVVWVLLSDRPTVIVRGGDLQYQDLYSKDFVQADMTFVLLCVIAGVVFAIVAMRLWRTHNLAVLVGCVVGGFVGAVLMWRIGEGLGGGFSAVELTANGQAEGTVIQLPLQLAAKGALVVWPLAACAVLTVSNMRRASQAHKALLRLLPEEQSELS